MENANSFTAPPAPEEWGRGRKHHACQLRLTFVDGTSSLVLRGGSSMSSAIRRCRARKDVRSVDLVRKLTRQEYRELRLREGNSTRPRRSRTPPRYPACEVRVTNRGVTSTRVYRKYWCEGTRRQLLAQKNVDSVDLVRRLTAEEYDAIYPDRNRRRKVRVEPIAPPPATVAPGPPEPDPSTPRVQAWEVLIRRGGVASKMEIHAVTRAEAQSLACAIDGVTAAVAIGSLAEDGPRSR